MKRTRVTAASFAGVLSPLAGIAASLAGPLPARGVEVPFTERVISTAAWGAWCVFATDVDGDGDTDVLSASAYDDKIAWYESDGGSPPSFTERVISTAADFADSVFATDVDGDGDTDVLSASWDDDKIAWYESDGGSPPTFTARVISVTADAAQSVFATDVDGDGDTDVLSASRTDETIRWYESDGGSPPSFTERVISTTAYGPVSVFAMDLDGDGDTDVLSASIGDDKIAWYENDGSSPPSFTEWVISTTADGAVSVFVTDLDGDGDTDVLSASVFDDKIAWYESDGGSPPTFTERVISTAADAAESVFATDVDGDGDTDVLSASGLDNKIAWYESDGGSPPSFTEWVISAAANLASSVFATDVDGDGDTDVLSASAFDDKIAWYENTTPPCGNGRIDPGEECDDGGESAACDADCTVAECGDGTLNMTAGEACDDGNTADCDGCRGDCSAVEGMCGDGMLDSVCETCDDGNNADCDGCRGDCSAVEGTCGDGTLDPVCEACDDGPDNSDTEPDACRTDCTAASCGDGVVDTGEECDGADIGVCVEGFGCNEECKCAPLVPMLPQWGLVGLGLLLLAGGTMVFGRHGGRSLRTATDKKPIPEGGTGEAII